MQPFDYPDPNQIGKSISGYICIDITTALP